MKDFDKATDSTSYSSRSAIASASPNPNVSSSCDWCSHAPADLSHMFYICSKLQTFWGIDFKTWSDILEKDLHLCLYIAIFGVTDPKPARGGSRHHCFLSPPGTLVDIIVVEVIWPSISIRLAGGRDVFFLEKIKFTISGSAEKFFVRWQPVITYFKNWSTITIFLLSTMCQGLLLLPDCYLLMCLFYILLFIYIYMLLFK